MCYTACGETHDFYFQSKITGRKIGLPQGNNNILLIFSKRQWIKIIHAYEVTNVNCKKVINIHRNCGNNKFSEYNAKTCKVH